LHTEGCLLCEGRITAPAGASVFLALMCCTCTDHLTNHFKKYGEITDAVIMKDRSTGHPRGFGFVTFMDASACKRVVQDKHVIDGRTVRGSICHRGIRLRVVESVHSPLSPHS
jgi:ribosomal protein L14